MTVTFLVLTGLNGLWDFRVPMFGKHFASMYTGSMIGAGSHVFAVIGYVIAHMKPDKVLGAQVELNPDLLAFVIGDSKERIREAIDFLCEADPKSRTKDEEGRRLIRVGEFDYRVVNGPKYMEIRNEEERREKNRDRQARHREKLSAKNGKPKGKPKLPVGNPAGEDAYARALGAGASDAQLDRIVTESLPEEEKAPNE